MLTHMQGFPGGLVVKNPPAVQGTRVRTLAREDPTGCGAAEPMSHDYGALALGPRHLTRDTTMMKSPCTTTRESPHTAMKMQHSQKIHKS